MLRVVGVRPLGPEATDAGRVRIGNTGAAEDMRLRPSGTARRHRPYSVKPS
jgi:hypothetical protein